MNKFKIKRAFSKISKKQWIILGVVLVVLIAILIAVAVVGNNKDSKKDETAKEEVTEVNDSADIIKSAEYEGLTIDNIILISKGDSSTFTATITNNTDTTKEIEDFDIVLKKDDAEIAVLYGYLGEPMEPGESRDINSSIGMKLTKDIVNKAEYREHVAPQQTESE